MKRLNLAVAVSIVLLFGMAGCKNAQQQTSAPAPQQQMKAEDFGSALTGKVAETMNSGGYTYICLENNGKKIWVAMPETKVKVGQQVTCQPGMEMKNFTSKTLKRTFDSVIFSGGLI